MIKIKVKQRRKIIILLLIVNVLSIKKSRKMNKLFLIIPEVLFFFLPNMKTIMKREKHGESQKSQEIIIIIAWEDIFSLF